MNQFDADQAAIQRLYLRGIISERVRDRAKARLKKMIEAGIKCEEAYQDAQANGQFGVGA